MQVCLFWGGRTEKLKQKKAYLEKEGQDRTEEGWAGWESCVRTHGGKAEPQKHTFTWDRRVRPEAAKAGGQELTKVLNIRGSKIVKKKIRTDFPDNVSD